MGKRGLQIFFDNRLILLAHQCPKSNEKDVLAWHFKKGRNIAEPFIRFAENEDYDRLVIWTGSEFKDLKEEFFALFKIVEAAGGIVKNEKGDLLCIFRNGKWDLPKGKINIKKETRKQGAIREVQEETGLKEIAVRSRLETTYHIFERKGRLFIKPTYWFEMYADSTAKLKPQTKEGISIVTWIDEEEFKEVEKNTYPSLKGLFNFNQLYPR